MLGCNIGGEVRGYYNLAESAATNVNDITAILGVIPLSLPPLEDINEVLRDEEDSHSTGEEERAASQSDDPNSVHDDSRIGPQFRSQLSTIEEEINHEEETSLQSKNADNDKTMTESAPLDCLCVLTTDTSTKTETADRILLDMPYRPY